MICRRPPLFRSSCSDDRLTSTGPDTTATPTGECSGASQPGRRRRASGPGPWPSALIESRRGTAIGLRALNDEWGAQFFDVPEEATIDATSAEHHFSGPEVVIDVQTHFSGPASRVDGNRGLDALYRPLMPDWWHDVDDGLSGGAARDMADYVRKVFLETETAVAVLTSGPGSPVGEPVDPQAAALALKNEEMAVARMLIDNLAGTGRLLNHAVVIANKAAEIEAMEQWHEELDPVGWKVYTPGKMTPEGWQEGWMLDDEQYGLPFLERARSLGAPVVCAHKGCAMLADNGSPRDVGPAARAFPDLSFVIYHSAFELELPEGPYTDETADVGANRLLRTVEDAGLGQGSNVYAELGTTWFSLIRTATRSRPPPRKAHRGARRGQRDLGYRQHLVRVGAAAGRRIPRLPDPRRHVRGVRLLAAHARDQGEDPR